MRFLRRIFGRYQLAQEIEKYVHPIIISVEDQKKIEVFINQLFNRATKLIENPKNLPREYDDRFVKCLGKNGEDFFAVVDIGSHIRFRYILGSKKSSSIFFDKDTRQPSLELDADKKYQKLSHPRKDQYPRLTGKERLQLLRNWEIILDRFTNSH